MLIAAIVLMGCNEANNSGAGYGPRSTRNLMETGKENLSRGQ